MLSPLSNANSSATTIPTKSTDKIKTGVRIQAIIKYWYSYRYMTNATKIISQAKYLYFSVHSSIYCIRSLRVVFKQHEYELFHSRTAETSVTDRHI